MKKALIAVGVLSTVVGVAVALPAIAIEPREAMVAWHTALMFGVTTAIGALFLLMLGHVAQASWLIVLRRPVEHVVGTLPVLALFFLPTLLYQEQLFPWAAGGIDMPHHVAEKVRQKEPYLNEGAFAARTLAYLVVLVTTGELLRHWSRKQDLARDDRTRAAYGRRMRALSSIGFPLLGLMVTFTFVDWIMSLEPAWYSTVFGPAVLSGGFTAAVGLLAVSMVIAERRGSLDGVKDDHRHAVGRVLFASICFWAYLNFAQYMLIWIADLPEEVRYFIRRQELGWQWVGVAIVFGHFVVPFFLLLSRRLKEVPLSLAFFGGWILVFHLLANFYLIAPAHRLVLRVHWADPFALAAVVGAMVAFAALRSIRMASVPVGDPGLHESLQYSSS